ncbi:hypothetical protein [Halorussus salinus]|uniref:hypothetical protein n=1 Tax=Halorussus salinus TaxID=1364935 RepID=UPI001092BB84|nr:hypothetical protein [Halorussus salinus]
MTNTLDFPSAVADALRDANDPESHVERDARTFHPSQIARCERRAYCSKLGLEDHSDLLGVFQTGTLIHEFLEDHMADQFPHADFERDIEMETDGIRFVGRTDCYDPDAQLDVTVVYLLAEAHPECITVDGDIDEDLLDDALDRDDDLGWRGHLWELLGMLAAVAIVARETVQRARNRLTSRHSATMDGESDE